VPPGFPPPSGAAVGVGTGVLDCVGRVRLGGRIDQGRETAAW